jgi:hypothetical protein
MIVVLECEKPVLSSVQSGPAVFLFVWDSLATEGLRRSTSSVVIGKSAPRRLSLK